MAASSLSSKVPLFIVCDCVIFVFLKCVRSYGYFKLRPQDICPLKLYLNNRTKDFLLLLLLLLLPNKFAHFLQIAITQPIFELGPPDFAW